MRMGSCLGGTKDRQALARGQVVQRGASVQSGTSVQNTTEPAYRCWELRLGAHVQPVPGRHILQRHPGALCLVDVSDAA